jgi:hypothetical protein
MMGADDLKEKLDQTILAVESAMDLRPTQYSKRYNVMLPYRVTKRRTMTFCRR